MSTELWAIVIGVALSLVVYGLESRRERAARRDEYRADVCAAIAERTATLERELAAITVKQPGSWAAIHPLLTEFSKGVSGLLPRARVAGYDPAVTHLRGTLVSFLAQWAEAEGLAKVGRNTADLARVALMEEGASREAAEAEARQRTGFSEGAWASQQSQLFLALANYLSELREGLVDHRGTKAFVPPEATWPPTRPGRP